MLQLWRRYGIGFGGALLWMLTWLLVVHPVLGGIDPQLVEATGVPGLTDSVIPVTHPYSFSMLVGGGLYLLLVLVSDAASLAADGRERADEELHAPQSGDVEG